MLNRNRFLTTDDFLAEQKSVAKKYPFGSLAETIYTSGNNYQVTIDSEPFFIKGIGWCLYYTTEINIGTISVDFIKRV